MFQGDDKKVTIPLIHERVKILHEVGEVLLKKYKGINYDKVVYAKKNIYFTSFSRYGMTYYRSVFFCYLGKEQKSFSLRKYDYIIEIYHRDNLYFSKIHEKDAYNYY